MANYDIPVNELNIKQITGDTAYFYGLDINLSQDDLPYTIPPLGQRRLPSTLNFVAYGDTVTVNGYLANPGKDIRIYARKIIFKNGAFIDNAGPDPDSKLDYPPGVPAEQQDETLGAKGAAGAAGGCGAPAGTIELMAESFEGDVGDRTGTVQINSFDIGQILKDICSKWITAAQTSPDLNPFVFPAIHDQFTMPNKFITGTVDIPDLRGDGLGNIAFEYVTWDQNSQNSILRMSIKNLSFTGNCTLAINIPPKTFSFPVSFSEPEIDITMEWVINPVKKIVTGRKVNIWFDNWVFVYDLHQITQLQTYIKSILDQINADLVQIIQSSVQDRVNKLIDTFSDPAIFGATPDLYISCKGGKGGRGEDGHSGIKGKMGDRGADSQQQCMPPYYSPPPESIGGKGATGGQGGDAGKSGPGAAGGNVKIGFINPKTVTINYDIYGGDGGPAASPGQGGPGGDGGPAGTYLALDTSSGRPGYKRVPSIPGPVGDLGPVASFKGVLGDSGPMGSLTVNSPAAAGGDADKPFDYAQLAPFMRVEQLLITQRAAVFSFLNAAKAEDYQYVLALAYWLVKITTPIIQPGFNASGWDSHDISTAKSIHDNAWTMIDNCQRGLDFYGNYPNWVPVLTLNAYQNRIDQLIALGTDIEKQFLTYLKDSTTAQEKIAALDQARQSLNTDIENDGDEISQINSDIGYLNNMIDDLTALLQKQQELIIKDEEIFTEEVRKKAEEGTGCSFGNMLKTVAVIIQFGAGISEGVGAISDAYALYKDFTVSKESFDKALQVIQEAEATVQDIKKGINDINSVQPPEVGLVATNKQDFDKFIQDFIGKISSAPALKNAVDHYFDMIDTRNQAICSYNALYIKRAAVQADMDQKTSRLDKVEELRLKQAADPALPVYLSFMQNAYVNLKATIVKKLYEENRALWYWSLQEEPFSTTDLNMATLAVTHSKLSDLIDTVKEHKSGPFQPYTEEIRITADDYPMAFRALPDTKKLVFSLSVSSPAFLNQYQVIANEFKLDFPDIKLKTGVLFVKMIHPGVSYQLSNAEEPAVQFVHLPRDVSYKIDYANPHNTGGGQIGSEAEGYIGLSPFTTWTLNFDQTGNEFLDLNLIQSVVITFSGTYLGSPKNKA